jgi:hypothetical protein
VFDHFWDFDRLVEDEAPKRRSQDLAPFYGLFGFRVYVTGMGCQLHGFTHV